MISAISRPKNFTTFQHNDVDRCRHLTFGTEFGKF